MGVVEIRKMSSTHFGGENLYSVKAQDSVQNGHIVQLGDLETGEQEVRTIKKVTNINEVQELVLIAQPEMRYDFESRADKRRLEDFVIEDGKIVRGYGLRLGDIFGISEDLVTKKTSGNVEVGHWLVLEANKLGYEEKDSDPKTTAKFVLKVEGKYNMNIATQVARGKVLPVTKMLKVRVVKYDR